MKPDISKILFFAAIIMGIWQFLRIWDVID